MLKLSALRIILDFFSMQNSDSPDPMADSTPDSPTQMSVEQWLESLRRTDRTFYNMMAMEVWSIAKTMDTLIPGFWSKFMENRQLAVKSFVNDRQVSSPGLRLEDLGNPDDLGNDRNNDSSLN